MNNILTTFTTLVAAGLLWLTLKGAYALTGSVPITMVLAALVVIQWAAARRALAALVAPESAGAARRWRRAMVPAALWLAAASVTVSFVGAELYEMFTAKGKAAGRFEAEQSTLRTRGRELQQALATASTVAAQYARHAQEMATREERVGGSCLAGSGAGAGPIRAFRRMDAAAAAGLVEQLSPESQSAAALLKSADSLRFEGAVPALRQSMVRAVDDLNSLRAAPLWPQIVAFVEAQATAANNVGGEGAAMRCNDPVRSLMLTQLQRSAKTVMVLKPLTAPELLDHADSRQIAQATLVRTWAAALGLLPSSLWQGKPIVEEGFRVRFGLAENPAVLSEGNLPMVLAWMLEFILIALLVLGDHDGRPQVPGRMARLRHWGGMQLRQRTGLVGAVARAVTGPAHPELVTRQPYIDHERLFADEAMEERAWTVAPWYRPWGARDIVVVPMSRYAAVRAARELYRANLLRRLASGIDTEQLMSDRRLAGVMRALGDPVPNSIWEVYQVSDPHLARWLLAQPIEARAVVGEIASGQRSDASRPGSE